jgi:hypothetical protein
MQRRQYRLGYGNCNGRFTAIHIFVVSDRRQLIYGK